MTDTLETPAHTWAEKVAPEGVAAELEPAVVQGALEALKSFEVPDLRAMFNELFPVSDEAEQEFQDAMKLVFGE